MNPISITVDMSSFKRWLAIRPEKMTQAMHNTITKASLLVERYGKLNAPVDSGRLRSSIFTTIRPMSATVSTNTNYAFFVHNGTRYMTGRPFMKDAERQALPQIQGILESEVKQGLE